MSGKPKGLIDDAPLLASSPAEWTLREGVNPTTATFDLLPDDAIRLLNGGKKTFRLTLDDLVVEGLYILHADPGPDPHIARLTLADRRFWWTYSHVLRRLNIRRHMGPRRLKNPQTLEIQPVTDDVQFAPWSLRDGSERWTAMDALEAVLDEVLEAEREYFRVNLGHRIGPSARDKLAKYPIEDLITDDNGAQAIQRILAYLPELAIFPDKRGEIRVIDRTSGEEAEALKGIGPEKVDLGHVEFIRHHRIRPCRVDVLFTREVEVRFDFQELPSKYSTVARDKDNRFTENVLDLPDFELEVGDMIVCQGTWITVDQAMTAWGPAPGIERELDHVDLQKAFVPFMGLWAPLGLAGILDPNKDWAARVAALQKNYRRTYRINRRWVDRIYSLKARRVAVLDPTTAAPSPAVAYADYCYLYSQRSLARDFGAGGASGNYAVNVKGYPKDGKIDETTKPAPAAVVIDDEDQGIFHIDYLVDPYRVYEMILPSMMTLAGRESELNADGSPGVPGPGGDLRDNTIPITFDMVSESGIHNIPKLTSSHQLAVILTAVPAAPNTDQQLHRVSITPDEVREYLPGAAREGLTNAMGPPMEIRIGGGIETARVAWMDDRSDDIERIFGVQEGEPNLDGLVVNETKDDQAASLRAIALATAIRVYAGFTDRYQGSITGKLGPDIELAGWLSEVEHGLDVDGHLFTRLNLPEKLPALNQFAVLDASSRAIVMRLVQPAGAKG